MRHFVLLLSLTLLAGCAVKQNPAKTTIYTPAGKIENHCPPGQAKKGKCVKL